MFWKKKKETYTCVIVFKNRETFYLHWDLDEKNKFFGTMKKCFFNKSLFMGSVGMIDFNEVIYMYLYENGK